MCMHCKSKDSHNGPILMLYAYSQRMKSNCNTVGADGQLQPLSPCLQQRQATAKRILSEQPTCYWQGPGPAALPKGCQPQAPQVLPLDSSESRRWGWCPVLLLSESPIRCLLPAQRQGRQCILAASPSSQKPAGRGGPGGNTVSAVSSCPGSAAGLPICNPCSMFDVALWHSKQH